jgi:hypothetical protein
VSDTSPDTRAIQDDIYRRMTGEERLRRAMEMSDVARELALARVRSEHPEWPEWEFKRELLRSAFGNQPWPPPLR